MKERLGYKIYRSFPCLFPDLVVFDILYSPPIICIIVVDCRLFCQDEIAYECFKCRVPVRRVPSRMLDNLTMPIPYSLLDKSLRSLVRRIHQCFLPQNLCSLTWLTVRYVDSYVTLLVAL